MCQQPGHALAPGHPVRVQQSPVAKSQGQGRAQRPSTTVNGFFPEGPWMLPEYAQRSHAPKTPRWQQPSVDTCTLIFEDHTLPRTLVPAWATLLTEHLWHALRWVEGLPAQTPSHGPPHSAGVFSVSPQPSWSPYKCFLPSVPDTCLLCSETL